MFGIDLKELVSRSRLQTGSDIPVIIRDVVSYIDNCGLEIEGILRQSGSTSTIEHFKQQYDTGSLVNLKDSNNSPLIDPHSAGIYY